MSPVTTVFRYWLEPTITLTTALTAEILETLGYTPKISLLSTDDPYEEMQNRKIDIFLGTWIPGLQSASQPYRDKGAIETVRTNQTERDVHSGRATLRL